MCESTLDLLELQHPGEHDVKVPVVENALPVIHDDIFASVVHDKKTRVRDRIRHLAYPSEVVHSITSSKDIGFGDRSEITQKRVCTQTNTWLSIRR